MSTMLRISHLAWPVTSLGPGRRAAMWLAGCPMRCKACITPQLQSENSGYAIHLETALARLLQLPAYIDGLSLTGGEPFFQATALTELLRPLKQQRPSWNILVFSGYSLEHLQTDDDCRRLLSLTDLLVDGSFMPERMPGSHPLLASANQRLHALSTCGQALLKACTALDANTAELGLSRRGEDWLIGILDQHERQQLHQGLCDD